MTQIEGRKPVMEALRSELTINKIIMAKNESRGPLGQILSLAKERSIPVQMVDRSVLDQISETPNHQGVIAQAASIPYWDLNMLLEKGTARSAPLYLVLDGIQDPHNFGSLLRSAEAAGVVGVVIPQRRAVGITPAVVKASAGAASYVPVCRVPNIARTLEVFKREGCWIAGADMDGRSYERQDLSGPLVLVVGGEGRGLGHAARKHCDFLVSIPMLGEINSLNAAVAGAILLFETVRQRRQADPDKTL